MPVSWSVKSKIVHESKAVWVGAKPRDGGFALLKEAFDFVHDNKEPGQLIVNFGTGGSVSDLQFTQIEVTATPQPEDESGQIPNIVYQSE